MFEREVVVEGSSRRLWTRVGVPVHNAAQSLIRLNEVLIRRNVVVVVTLSTHILSALLAI